MNCEWIQERVHRILDRQLEPDEAAGVEDHMAECGHCRELLRRAAAHDSILESALPLPSAPDDFAADMISALDGCAPARGRTIRLWLPLSAAAAVLVVAPIAHWTWTWTKGATTDPTAALAAATVLSCEGDVAARAPGATQWAAVAAGQRLPLGTKLKTADRASAQIQFHERARVMVSGSSVAQVADAGLVVQSGRVFAWVEKTGSRFCIATPHAAARVRGTRFNVDCRAGDATVLSVVDGLVEFGNDSGIVHVAANMQSVAAPHQEPATPLAVDPLAAVSWAGITSDALVFATDVGFRVRRGSPAHARQAGAATFMMGFEYGVTRYADLRVYCHVTNADGAAAAQAIERVCWNAFRYETRRLTFSGLAPGAYRASFRVGHGDRAIVRELEFAVE